ncbi:response regulator transcription factor [Ruminiclostridium cellulolyticum]|uniref:Stage 0 sporulation protein A homolog n=1 Tax=Ruminiclostridium cellulolyticum (strain ATCC 35319 / DSM 5812 / JCM 6584 / H10) TaxID=394503 RepID=B8I014_RUMCH|nr:response regulator transcription factor [Ruminiclostridium cellulolyticum]ACL75514.1 two component transcriptional regulator, winged helix family [Ruminiclostridium cellulolyticum H10]
MVEQIKILIVEDDREINRLIADNLVKEGYCAISTHDGAAAVEKLRADEFQLVILDIMLPKVGGYEVLQKIREKGNTPVLILSAKCEETDKIIGLGLGADDYLAKPFGIGELTARVKAQLRRYLNFSWETDKRTQIIRHMNIEMNVDTYEVKVGDNSVTLTAKEFEILKLFLQNPRKVFTKNQLFKSIWGENYINDENTVMVHIRRLREKIEKDPSNPSYIQTIWGIGYKLVEE